MKWAPTNSTKSHLFSVDSMDSKQEQAWRNRDLSKFFARSVEDLLKPHDWSPDRHHDTSGRRGVFFRCNSHASKKKQLFRPAVSYTYRTKEYILSNVHIVITNNRNENDYRNASDFSQIILPLHSILKTCILSERKRLCGSRICFS